MFPNIGLSYVLEKSLVSFSLWWKKFWYLEVPTSSLPYVPEHRRISEKSPNVSKWFFPVYHVLWDLWGALRLLVAFLPPTSGRLHPSSHSSRTGTTSCPIRTLSSTSGMMNFIIQGLYLRNGLANFFQNLVSSEHRTLVPRGVGLSTSLCSEHRRIFNLVFFHQFSQWNFSLLMYVLNASFIWFISRELLQRQVISHFFHSVGAFALVVLFAIRNKWE